MSVDWLDVFPALSALDLSARHVLKASARAMTFPRGATPFRQGNPCGAYIFVISGTIRVQLSSETGREIVLYRVGDGETCILTTACLMARQDYPAEAVAETEVRAAVLGAAPFRELVARSAPFRDFVFSAYGQRITDLMLVVEEVAFRRTDGRLARFLLDKKDPGGRLNVSHQELAAELGTAREVISRQLKEFERRSWIALDRRRIEVLNVPALQTLAETSATE